MSQLSLLSLSISGSSGSKSDPSSRSEPSSGTQSDSSIEADPPAAYHVNLANLVPTLYLPPPLRGMQRLRAVAQRQWAPQLDVMGILAKAVMRPRPQIHLGPIDHTASCVIVDLDLPDRPLVWASDSFCHMSGYALDDIRGRNPRFMQAPGGHVLCRDHPPSPSPGATSAPTSGKTRPSASTSSSTSSTETIPATSESDNSSPKSSQDGSSPKSDNSKSGQDITSSKASTYIPPPDSHVPAGSHRTHSDNETVRRIKSKLDANEEIQTTVLNYRKDGTPFWNWLSIVPVREAGEDSRFRYHVGIMADLVQQPRAIMQTMRAGFYIRSPPA